MLAKFEIHAVHTKVDDQLKNYVNKKIGGLDKYVSRHSRKSAHGEVHLKESNAKDKNRFTCEVNLHLPKESIVIKEKSLNMFAAIDIAEAKLKIKLKQYKDRHENGKLHRHLLGRIRGKNSL
jgi:putative sigma-54 modulation protein